MYSKPTTYVVSEDQGSMNASFSDVAIFGNTSNDDIWCVQSIKEVLLSYFWGGFLSQVQSDINFHTSCILASP